MPAKSGPKPAVRASSPRAPADALAEAHKEHASHLVDLSRTCEQLRQRVGLLLVTEGIVLGAPVQGRVKAWTSVADKLRRSNGRRSLTLSLSCCLWASCSGCAVGAGQDSRNSTLRKPRRGELFYAPRVVVSGESRY